MNITTEHEPGDNVYFIRDSKIVCESIWFVTIKLIKGSKIEVLYYFNKLEGNVLYQPRNAYYEHEVFSSKEELIESLK